MNIILSFVIFGAVFCFACYSMRMENKLREQCKALRKKELEWAEMERAKLRTELEQRKKAGEKDAS